jgi:hypothetical protein
VFGIFLNLDLDGAVNRLFYCFAEFARDPSRALLRVMV